ncbi:hypothetical protein Daus18300_002712 [Diaporthe australafricana]|uniref:Actin-like ATPase domain-containing protein n=1 Tax=Diaporthe australafricana TaxID=127596 RepID=A0ABR3XKG3_9PEZI
MSAPIKLRTPSPLAELEEIESFDLYTPGQMSQMTPIGQSQKPANSRKRSSDASSVNSSAKKSSGAISKKDSTQAAAQPKANPRPKRVKPCTIVVGIDTGTTHSGVAYVHSGNTRIIYTITSWDDTNDDRVKVPTVIRFDDQGDIWGVDAKNDPDALRWFKLALIAQQDLDQEVRASAQIQEARRALRAQGKSPGDVISAFLRHMWKHVVAKIKLAEGEKTVETSKFHVVFTLPAIWPNYAREGMLRAIKGAGILDKRPAGDTTYDFVSEPEAAAIATLSGIYGQKNLKACYPVGDTFVVVDCGGGTVDIITYIITSMSPMTVQEVVKGKGALCGAIFVDERFKDLLVKKLIEISADAMDRVTDEEMQEMMSRNWEDEIRSQFKGAPKTWTIRHPISLINPSRLDHNGGFPTFTVTSDEVEEVFKSSVEKIWSLVREQIEATAQNDKEGRNLPKYVVLVGGFGTSGYLQDYLQQRCQDVEVLQRKGSDPWSAVSRGAVIHGMAKLKIKTPYSVVVGARISRLNIGVVGQEIWDEEKHDPVDQLLDHILQEHVAINVMKWHLVQGQEIRSDHNVSFNLTKHLAERPEKIETDIYMSPAEVPPKRRDESVRKAFKLTWNIKVKWRSLEVFTNSKGKEYRKLEYVVEMGCGAGSSLFSVYHRGRKVADKNVSLEVYEAADA